MRMAITGDGTNASEAIDRNDDSGERGGLRSYE